MQKVQHKKSATRKKWNAKRMQHEESSHEKSATQRKCDMNAARKRVKTIKHEENMKSERNSDILRELNAKKVQNEKCAARRKYEK